ncbi:MAG: Gldg family protein [Proteobacteria bacterium]|nr:Gldg family protein [Pseudomonadota bacterium]
MKRGARFAYALVPLLMLAAVVVGVRTLDRHNQVWDVSRDARNSLDQKTVKVLAMLPAPLEVVALVPDEGPVRAAVRDFFTRYQREKPNLSLRFLDPRQDDKAPEVRRARLGEVLFQYGERFERVTELNESAVTNGMARLARSGARYVVFLANNGERRIARQANHDLSLFAAELEQRGLPSREYVLGKAREIPDNTAVLVLASPAVAYAAGEVEEIERYVARGGNLLWLTEPDAKPELAPLERALGFERLPGTVVDPVGLTKFKNPAYAVALEQVKHPLLADFSQTVVFPYATALLPKPNIDWRAVTLAHSGGEAWNETGTFAGNVGFDGADEVQGEMKLALALTKARGDGGEQRVVVVGDGDFLANSFVGNLGNLEFGRRVVEWLASGDALLDIAVPAVPDATLDLALWQRVTIFLFFGVGLPLALGGNGLLLWWRRRHA